MRFLSVAALLLATSAAASAQDRPYVEPEIRTDTGPATAMGLPASSAVADLTARIDALEAQLARLTGQAEENGYRVRQLETEVARLTRELAERPAPAPEPVVIPADEAPVRPGAVVDAPATGDAGEDAYLVGFRLWEAGKFADAQTSLQAMAKKYPKHKRASYALNLAGRSLLDDGKPASAAKVLLSNYQTNPKGERAADSLYFLGQALVQLKKPAEACKVYDELADVYPTMRDWVKQRLPKARTDAKCGQG
jgi:TolA-binding protein